MNLHEYQAKQLFARYGLPAPVGYACTTPREAEEAASKIGAGPWVVKCQVHAGGRGKAGGVKVVNSKEDIRAFAENWLGKRLVTYQTDANGQPVNQILVEAATDIAKELYLGAVVDRSFPSRGLYGLHRRRRGNRKSGGRNSAPDPQSCA
ncbi:succinyl-CoA synthetase beta chain with ATP-grasp domain [Escherichia coli]|uniref:Succinyl-CoA synthetase beta chain with ATP-grasp domain n=1 Tax=Escherichia coli TaxID=562 RepID=A0A377K9R2_ECOLX|nr:succinyl-CoA synthetase beta chain with ATP-grasp domain [Escherichia coli]